jgi:hypothetical protein
MRRAVETSCRYMYIQYSTCSTYIEYCTYIHVPIERSIPLPYPTHHVPSFIRERNALHTRIHVKGRTFYSLKILTSWDINWGVGVTVAAPILRCALSQGRVSSNHRLDAR